MAELAMVRAVGRPEKVYAVMKEHETLQSDGADVLDDVPFDELVSSFAPLSLAGR